MTRPIPTTIDGITADWVTAALKASAVIGHNTEVSAVESRVLGAGQGFAGELARMTITYSTGSGPRTAIVKIPTANPENRSGSELLGVYEREARMYQEVLPDLDLPAAQLYYADLEPNPDAAGQMKSIQKADRLPIWVLRLMAKIVRRFVRGKSRANILILEDLAPATIGDQVLGCTTDEAAAVLRVAARLHAQTWEPRTPPNRSWLVSGAIAPRLFHAGFLDVRRKFLRNAGKDLSPHTLQLMARVRREGAVIHSALVERAPTCLLHGDLRLDNIFFDGADDVRALIDWQMSNTGPAAIDIAYFISGSLPPTTLESEIDALLVEYHAQLVANGVTGYSYESFETDYEDALLLTLARLSAVEQIDFGDDRGPQLVEKWISALDARLTRVAA